MNYYQKNESTPDPKVERLLATYDELAERIESTGANGIRETVVHGLLGKLNRKETRTLLKLLDSSVFFEKIQRRGENVYRKAQPDNTDPWCGPVVEKPTPYQVNDRCRDMLEAWRGRLGTLGLNGLIGDKNALDPARAAEADAKMARLSPEDQPRVLGMMRDINAFDFWHEYREVYFFHPAMTRSLNAMKSDNVKIPGKILKNLRHPNPFFLTSAATPIVHADGHPGRVLGFYTHGAISSGYPQVPGSKTFPQFREDAQYSPSIGFDTHYQDINALHVMVVSEVLDHEERNVIDYDLCHLTVPIVGDFTLTELVDGTRDSFAWSGDLQGDVYRKVADTYLLSMSRLVVSHLLYAVSRSFEMDRGKADRPALPPKAKTKDGKKPLRPGTVYPVGYRMGAAIQDSMRRAQQKPLDGPGMPTGKVMPAHIRSPHTHLYRVGPGRSEIDVKFLGPIPVNQHLDDGDMTTLHPVR